MKCFTATSTSLVAGLDSRPHGCVCVGDGGKNSHLDTLPLFTKNPPKFTDGKIYDAHPVYVGEGCYNLAKPRNEKDERILVRLAHYDCRVMTGSATEVGFGFNLLNEDEGAYWYDSVRVLTPFTVLFLKEQCGTYRKTLVLVAGKSEAKLMPLEEFDALMSKKHTRNERVKVPDASLADMMDYSQPELESDDLRRLKLGGSGPEIPEDGFAQ